MTVPNRPFKYALPRAEEYLRVVLGSIIGNFRNDNQAVLSVSPLVSKAYTIVNETGAIPYRDYDADTKFLGEE